MHPPLHGTIQQLTTEFSRIPPDRMSLLQKLTTFIRAKADLGRKIEMVFICTHNSRRSHISQIWAQAAAVYYGISNVESYSGGTEATAFNPRAVRAMEAVGFHIEKEGNADNSIYRVYFGDGMRPVIAYSKRYDDASNPKEGFAAIMTCSHADENCPVISGMEKRISLPYDDPKDFDGTPEESEKYLERVNEIGREILYAFSLV